MRLQSSYSKHVPWADEEPGSLGEGQVPQSYGKGRATRKRKLLGRRHAPVTITAGLLFVAGLAAGSLMVSDRIAGLARGEAWSEPSTSWTALNDKSVVGPVREAKVDNAVLRTTAAPLVQEQVRRPDPEPPLVKAANPVTTSSFGGQAAGARDLAWLPPESEKRPEPLEAEPAPPRPRVMVTSPEPAPVKPPAASPAPSLPAPEVADLIRRARGHIDLGDIAGARLLLERAAAGSDPSALMALAETYDPAMLSKWRARGIKADANKARDLYQRAAESGLTEARARHLALR